MKAKLFYFFGLTIFLMCSNSICINTLKADNFFWTGAVNSNWSEPGNWNCTGSCPGSDYPGEGGATDDNVTISTGTPSMDVAATIGDFTFSGGSISGANTLTISGTMAWTAGTIGTPLTIANGATLNISSSGSKVLNGTLTLNGTTNHSAGTVQTNSGDIINNAGIYNMTGGNINISNSAQFNNTGTFDVNMDGEAFSGFGGPFDNDGTFTRSGGSGKLTIACDFTNDGTFNHNSGTILDFNSSPFIQNGTFNLQGSEELETSTTTISANFSLANGQLWDMNGSTTFNLNYSTPGQLDFGPSGSGSITGTGSLTISNSLRIGNSNGTTVSAPITINSGATLTLNSTGQKAINATLTLDGTTNHSDGNIRMQSSGILNNGGTFNMTGGGIIFNGGQINNTGTFDVNFDATIDGGSSDTFDNDGTFTRSGGTGTLEISCAFVNDGTFNHNSGNKLEFSTLTQNGTLNLQGTEELETNNTTVNATFTLTNGQLWDINAGLTMNLNYSTTGNIDFQPGSGTSVSGTGSLTISHTLTVGNSNGISVNIPVTINSGATFNISGTGAKTFNNTFNLNGTTNHSEGTLNLSTDDIINNGGTYNMSGGEIDFAANNAQFNNSGTFNMTGGNIDFNSTSAQLNNTGTFDVDFDGTAFSSASNGAIDNDGTFTRSNSTGTLTINADFINDGTFEQTSTGTVTFGFGAPFTNNNLVRGIGTVNFNSTFSQNSDVSPGTSPGILALNKFDNSGGTLNIEMQGSTTAGTDYDQLQVSSAVTLGGTLNISFLNGFEPSINDEFVILTCSGGCSGNFSTINHPGGNPNAWEIDLNTSNQVILRLVQGLPVELTDFQVVAKESHVLLKWQTANEINNLGFHIQRSEDGLVWINTDFVEGNSTSNANYNYSYIDIPLKAGGYYYRLEQEDLDGKKYHSEIRYAEWKIANDDSILSVYPNPTQGEVLVDLKEIEQARVQITNLKGIIVYDSEPAGNNTQLINLSEFPKGIYFLKILTPKGIFSKKLILQR